MDNCIGPRLLVDGLRKLLPGTVVVIDAAHLQVVFTANYVGSNKTISAFEMPQIDHGLILFHQPDGTLKDGLGNEVPIYEYTGDDAEDYTGPKESVN